MKPKSYKSPWLGVCWSEYCPTGCCIDLVIAKNCLNSQLGLFFCSKLECRKVIVTMNSQLGMWFQTLKNSQSGLC